MKKLKRQVLAVLASGALMAAPLSPVMAGTTIEISGNGSDSSNEAAVVQSSTTVVTQTNDADIDNNVDADAKTGGNDANDNTGGNVEIDTGNASTDVDVENNVNSNAAEVDCCLSGDTEVVISGNGTGSDNDAALIRESATQLFQENAADVDNNVDADAATGGNEANDNTGGDVQIDTGNAEAHTSVSTTANANMAQVGGDDDAGSVSLRILDNGSDTTNNIGLALLSEHLITQANAADVDNNVDTDAKTGKNDANDNTNGDVMIDTGDATTDVSVDNMVNFNAADIDCGCLTDLLAKVDGNGTESENYIGAELASAQAAFQDNGADLDNNVDGDAYTGKNDAEDNTGETDSVSDPAIDTGDADSTVHVSNSGNSNSFGDLGGFDFPEVEFNFNLSMSLATLLGMLGL